MSQNKEKVWWRLLVAATLVLSLRVATIAQTLGKEVWVSGPNDVPKVKAYLKELKQDSDLTSYRLTLIAGGDSLKNLRLSKLRLKVYLPKDAIWWDRSDPEEAGLTTTFGQKEDRALVWSIEAEKRVQSLEFSLSFQTKQDPVLTATAEPEFLIERSELRMVRSQQAEMSTAYFPTQVGSLSYVTEAKTLVPPPVPSMMRVVTPVPSTVSTRDGYYRVSVPFGTNRNVFRGENGDAQFGTKDSRQLTFGRADTTIPFRKKKPFVDLYTDDNLIEFTNYNVIRTKAEWLSELRKTMSYADVDSGKPPVLVYIHGYNNTHEEAARQAAHLGYELKGCIPTFFSWPANGGPLGIFAYASDCDDADHAASHLVEYLRTVRASNKNARINIIAHSMGNRVLLGALRQLKQEGGYTEPLFDNIVMIAADIDVRDFEQEDFDPLKGLANRYTLYASSLDKILKFRDLGVGFGEYNRVGQGGELLTILNGLDSIDASECKVEFWSTGHSYYMEQSEILKDLWNLLSTGKSAANRGLKPGPKPGSFAIGLGWVASLNSVEFY